MAQLTLYVTYVVHLLNMPRNIFFFEPYADERNQDFGNFMIIKIACKAIARLTINMHNNYDNKCF